MISPKNITGVVIIATIVIGAWFIVMKRSPEPVSTDARGALSVGVNGPVQSVARQIPGPTAGAPSSRFSPNSRRMPAAA